MLLKYFYDDALAQASYMVGCVATGEALVIDPLRDIHPYLEVAQAEGLQITHITETHIHADYVSGSRELSAATGAPMFLSDMGDADWKYGFTENVVPVSDGDMWMVGNIKVDVIHTPGHTPEHITFMITDTAGADKPMGLFTGDFIFVGNIGRPDLLEEAAGITGTREPGARLQFANIERFKQLPDYLQIWPGHGAGSACGKGLGAIPSSTLGYEKLFNEAFQFDDEDAFVAWLLDGQPEAPKYFAQMKKVNKDGAELLQDTVYPSRIEVTEFTNLIAQGAQILDTRSVEATAEHFISGTINIPGGHTKLSTYVGWYIDFERPLYLIAAPENVKHVVSKLRAVGYDNTPGYFVSSEIEHYANLSQIPQISPQELAARMQHNNVLLLDVRGRSEYADKRIGGSRNVPMGYILRHLNTIPRDKPIVTQCAGGTRSQVVASILRGNGYDDVSNLSGGINAWVGAGLPVKRGEVRS